MSDLTVIYVAPLVCVTFLSTFPTAAPMKSPKTQMFRSICPVEKTAFPMFVDVVVTFTQFESIPEQLPEPLQPLTSFATFRASVDGSAAFRSRVKLMSLLAVLWLSYTKK